MTITRKEVPDDVPDDQINLYRDALMGLTPEGRGSSGVDECDVEDGNAFF